MLQNFGCDRSTSQGIKEQIVFMFALQLSVLFFPIALSYDHVSCSLASEYFSLLPSPDNINQRYLIGNTDFIKLATKSRGSCRVDDPLVRFHPIDVDHRQHSERIDDASCCAHGIYILRNYKVY